MQLASAASAGIFRDSMDAADRLEITHVHASPEGDTFFPPFEDQFELKEELADGAEFQILHYTRLRAEACHTISFPISPCPGPMVP